ncbi:MAG TPA: hypothetical protein VJ755_09610, partial [Gemmatimonadales bacterium]|nr:hypothetical protein [Gemmatimonadales bacterium]
MRTLLINAWTLVLAVSPLAAQRPDPMDITVAELSARLRYVSSDLFEGRAPGTRGEALTTAYLSSELASFGVRPGAGDAWLQPLAIVTHQPVPDAPIEARISGRMTRPLQHGRDIRFANWEAAGDVATGGDLVFVGYGIDAPIYNWNDFARLDLRGKIAVALLGEPNIDGDLVHFNGFRASRFARLTDKVAEMQRRGAVGVLFIRPAGSLSQAPPTGQRRLAARAAAGGVSFTGLLTDSAFAALLPARSPSLAALLASAARPGFRPLPLGVRLDVRFSTRPVTVTTNNVVGVIPGRDSALAREHVVLTAHL